MKIHGTSKGGALSHKDFGVAFGGGAVVPDIPTIDDLVLHLDANNTDSITKSATDYVSVWGDLSDQSNDLSQSTGSKQPQWIANEQNGLPSIFFKQSNECTLSRSTATGGTTSQPTTYCFVGKFENNGYFWGAGSTTTRQILVVSNNGSSDFDMFAGSNWASGFTSLSSDYFQIIVEYNGASSKLWITGASTTPDYTGNPGTKAQTGFRLAARYNDSNWGGVRFCELAVYEKSLSTSEIGSIQEYFQDKWDVP